MVKKVKKRDALIFSPYYRDLLISLKIHRALTHEYCRSTCVGEMWTPKSWLSSRALLCSGTPPPAKKLVNLY